jgi:hypothetical protein
MAMSSNSHGIHYDDHEHGRRQIDDGLPWLKHVRPRRAAIIRSMRGRGHEGEALYGPAIPAS